MHVCSSEGGVSRVDRAQPTPLARMKGLFVSTKALWRVKRTRIRISSYSSPSFFSILAP